MKQLLTEYRIYMYVCVTIEVLLLTCAHTVSVCVSVGHVQYLYLFEMNVCQVVCNSLQTSLCLLPHRVQSNLI